jgi:hypothetical protein
LLSHSLLFEDDNHVNDNEEEEEEVKQKMKKTKISFLSTFFIILRKERMKEQH